MKPRVTSFAPQFLVDDLGRSIGYYEKLGFTFWRTRMLEASGCDPITPDLGSRRRP
jgi:hypothetical protein